MPKTGTKEPPIFNSNVGRSLSTYIDFYLCQGQQQAAALGYSPLPINLVQGAFLQVNKIPGTIGAPNIDNYGSCNNPTFTNGKDILLADAPYPTKCQKVGSPLDCTATARSRRRQARPRPSPARPPPQRAAPEQAPGRERERAQERAQGREREQERVQAAPAAGQQR